MHVIESNTHLFMVPDHAESLGFLNLQVEGMLVLCAMLLVLFLPALILPIV